MSALLGGLAALALCAAPVEDAPRSLLRALLLEGEVGPAYVFQNDNRYGPGGTPYTAAQVGQQRNLFIGKRLSAEARLGERHGVILLYAPLDLTTRATLPLDITFKGSVFRSGEVVDHRYLFDGYRASYLYRAVGGSRFTWDVGASFQVRNASVELRTVDQQPSRFEVENDIGVVFALKTRLRYAPGPRWWVQAEADALSSFGVFRSFSGGIYDLALSLGTPLARQAEGFLRLRLLGGGANVPRRNIENWANLFFATAGVRLDLIDLLD